MRGGCFVAAPTDWLLRNPCEYGRFQAVFRWRYLDPEAERGRALRWVAGDEASPKGEAARSIASRRTPLVGFAIVEPSKEAHDSLVPVFQCRRSAKPALGARGVRGRAAWPRREPTSASGLAGHHYQDREIASARYQTNWGLAMTVVGFSPQSRTLSVNRLAMTVPDARGAGLAYSAPYECALFPDRHGLR